MKRSHSSPLKALLVAAACTCLSHAAHSQLIIDTFDDTSGGVSPTFSNDYSGAQFSPSNTGGIGGTGGLSKSGTDGELLYRPGGTPAVYDLSAVGTTYSLSMSFKWDSPDSEQNLFSIGFVQTGSALEPNSSNKVFGGLRAVADASNQVRFRYGAGSGDTGGTAGDTLETDLVIGNWYDFQFSATPVAYNSSGTKIYSLTLSLYDLGADGTAIASLVGSQTVDFTLTGGFTNASQSNARYFASRSAIGPNSYDNLGHTMPVPEPGTAALLALGGAWVICGKGRRRRQA